MSDLLPLPEIQLGRYRHYKGAEYEVIGIVRHSETLEALVLYFALSEPSALWVRPHAMFVGQIEINGQQKLRFAPVPK